VSLRVCVAIAAPGRQELIEIVLADGSRVSDALAAPGVRARLEALGIEPAAVGIWSKRCAPQTALRDGDRVEIYRPIVADAKEMRRRRARLRTSTRSRSGR
jgi:putative ubiquitin-RnfH superfamily antitoxin RatB of RatAB toxin-antitoxin module